MARLPGQMWVNGVAGKGAEGRISINKSLGRILFKGDLANSSGGGADTKFQTLLGAILALLPEEIAPWRNPIRSYLDRLDQFKALPLWVAHHDLDEMNVLTDDDRQVTGLIDWELSAPFPFGIGLGYIHTIADGYTCGKFWEYPNSRMLDEVSGTSCSTECQHIRATS
ncbi:hypothetical protein VUR80DRAFT_7521 [Thermomyces stellatus]